MKPPNSPTPRNATWSHTLAEPSFPEACVFGPLRSQRSLVNSTRLITINSRPNARSNCAAFRLLASHEPRVAPRTQMGAMRRSSRQSTFPWRQNSMLPTRLCTTVATRFVALATLGLRPKAINAGSVRNEPPPAIELTTPETSPAKNSSVSSNTRPPYHDRRWATGNIGDTCPGTWVTLFVVPSPEQPKPQIDPKNLRGIIKASMDAQKQWTKKTLPQRQQGAKKLAPPVVQAAKAAGAGD